MPMSRLVSYIAAVATFADSVATCSGRPRPPNVIS